MCSSDLKPVTVGTVADSTHDGDNLLNRPRIGRVLLAPIARRAASVMPGIVAGERRCPAASSSTDSINLPLGWVVAAIRAEPLLPREQLAATA